jgi:hypothetical protein
LQVIRIDGAPAKPTAPVQSAAMASVPPHVPTYRPLLPKTLIQDSFLSAPQLESVNYAGNAHEVHLKGWFKRGEIEGQLMAAAEGDEGAFRSRKGWFLGDGTVCGKGRQVAGFFLDNWLRGRRRAVWVSNSEKLVEDARRDWLALLGTRKRYRAAVDIPPGQRQPPVRGHPLGHLCQPLRSADRNA